MIGHVGTTRAYLLRNENLVQITRDHTLRSDLESRGQPLTKALLATVPHKVVTRSLGLNPTVEVDHFEVALVDGDVLLLCSAGLWEFTTDEDLRDCLRGRHDPWVTCESLVSRAQHTGFEDDITVIVAQVQSPELVGS